MSVSKRTLKEWEDYRQHIRVATAINATETEAQKKERIQQLLANPIEFIKYYFAHIVDAEPSKFQKRFAKKGATAQKGIIVLRWFRGAAKTTYTWMVLINRMFTKMSRFVVWAEHTYDKASESLNLIKCELLDNQRLINDFGNQMTPGQWEQGDFTTQVGCRFVSLGSGQNPRGLLNRNVRPDTIILNDIDDDEECRNEEILTKKWEWLTGGLFGCFGYKGGVVIVPNNKIAKDCLVERLSQLPAADVDIVHLTDSHGVSNWPELFTPEVIQEKIDTMPDYMYQREFFEVYIKRGKTFKPEWFVYGKIPPLSSFQALVSYTDPGFKNTKTADSKSTILLGLHLGKIFIIKAFCDFGTVGTMIEWNYEVFNFVHKYGQTVFMYMEQVFLQDLLFKDFAEVAKDKNQPIPLIGDTRKKPDKDTRIEAMSFYFEKGNVILNKEEENNHHMKRLVDQFIDFNKGSSKVKKDGPDAFEGGVHKLIEHAQVTGSKPAMGKNKPNKKYKV
ncbi:MAG: hypothetical protein LCH37_13025 [Bacteroidetes bacterium]|nr:hypothetical protein [Bacteroidota bacterium]